MPIRVYKCKNCDLYFEVILKHDEIQKKCIHCGSCDIEKQITAPGICFIDGVQAKYWAVPNEKRKIYEDK